jgi:hypothetical protein
MTVHRTFTFRLSTLLLLVSASAILLWLNCCVKVSIVRNDVHRPSDLIFCVNGEKPSPWTVISVHKGWPLAHMDFRFAVRSWKVRAVMRNPAALQPHPLVLSIPKLAANGVINTLIIGVVALAAAGWDKFRV